MYVRLPFSYGYAVGIIPKSEKVLLSELVNRKYYIKLKTETKTLR